MSAPRRVLVAAMYEFPFDPERSLVTVCLGIRIGVLDDVGKLERALVRQIRARYPEFFGGMKPSEIQAACDFNVYSLEPDKNGFPEWLGETVWWR